MSAKVSTGYYEGLNAATEFLKEKFGINISQVSFRKAVKAGKIPSYKPFKQYIFKEEDLISFVESTKQEGRTNG